MPQEGRPRGVRRAVEAVSSWLNVVQRVLVAAVTALVASSALLLIWQVADRSVFAGGQNWIDEYARLSLIWMTFLGAAVLIRERKHLAVEYFVEKMGDRAQRAMSVATDIALIALMGVLLSTWVPVWEASSVLKSPSLGIPRSVLALAGLISYALTAVYCLESLARTLLGMEPPPKVLKDDDGALVV